MKYDICPESVTRPPPGELEPEEEPIKRRADDDWTEEQIHQYRHDRCAEAALAHYKKKKRTNYKLVTVACGIIVFSKLQLMITGCSLLKSRNVELII